MRLKTRWFVGLGALALGLIMPKGDAAVNVIHAHERFEPADAPVFGSAPNLFAHCPVTASPHWSDRVPEFAVDGSSENSGNHWAAENIPVWLTVHLAEPQELNAIHLWTYWGGERYYQYVIEGSLDGEDWTVLVDQRDNTAPATAQGEIFSFPTTRVKQVRTTFTYNSVSNTAGGHIVEIEGYRATEAAVAAAQRAEESWGAVTPGLHGGLGSLDHRYPRDEAPTDANAEAWTATAWRGERVAGQFVLWSADGAAQVRLAPTDLQGADGAIIHRSQVRARMERYVTADRAVVADPLEPAGRFDIAARSARPVWLSVDVPAETAPGVYKGTLQVTAAGGRKLSFPLEVRVLAATLPAPGEWAFWLDLWQNPYAVARYHHVEPWSDAHFGLLEPHLKLLAEAGQKCITASILYQPWGTQTYDPYDTMIEWIRRADGTWSYDYTHFDQYVELAQNCGITGAINCYSMVPWSSAFRYLDEATGDYQTLYAGPGTPEYEAHWEPFLRDFVQHLRAKGWLERTAIAMDERPLDLMRPMLAFLDRVAPELDVALAGSNEPEFQHTIDDWCAFITPPMDPAIAAERTRRDKPSTFYVCCGPGVPNTFTFSPPAESAWMGWYAAAQGYTGFLRWAFDSWTETPLLDTSYVTWPAGDCFFVYPGARSSVRFERLREGIQDYEKVRLVRAALEAQGPAGEAGLARLNEALSKFSYEAVISSPAAGPVNEAKAVLEELAEGLF